jgi:hypothetical protein
MQLFVMHFTPHATKSSHVDPSITLSALFSNTLYRVRNEEVLHKVKESILHTIK